MSLTTPTLHTARLRLRRFDDADANALFALHSNDAVLRFWDAPPWSERVRAERFIATCRQMAAEGTGVRLAVDRVGDGAFIGWCSLTRWNPDYRSASMGYCFDAAAWGHGYATEASYALLRWAFDDEDGLTDQVGVERRTPPTIGIWTSRGRNTLLEEPRPERAAAKTGWLTRP